MSRNRVFLQQKNKGIALVTGASMGIGLELAREHAKRGGDLILVARSGGLLKEVKNEFEMAYKVSVYVIEKDLLQVHAVQELYQEVKGKRLQVEYLINNAGFGNYGFFSDTRLKMEEDMIGLNITVLTQLCKMFLQDMLQQKRGAILNVASLAAFQAGPTMAVYFASKAYVLSFSEALSNELKGKGVSVTALCPGPTQSNFSNRANLLNSPLFNRNMDSAEFVAKVGYTGMIKGRRVVIPGLKNKILAFASQIAPRHWATAISRKMQEIK